MSKLSGSSQWRARPADNLATAMVADALGEGQPIFVAPSMNPGLWNHPQTREPAQRLRAWGCTIIEPQVSPQRVTIGDDRHDPGGAARTLWRSVKRRWDNRGLLAHASVRQWYEAVH